MEYLFLAKLKKTRTKGKKMSRYFVRSREREQRERVRQRVRERDHDTLPLSHGRGEIGHAELTAEGLRDALLALFDKMVRGLEEARISSFVAVIISHKRRPRAPQEPFCPRFSGDKGERKIFNHLLVVLYERYASLLVGLVELIPTYGSWRGLLNPLLECNHGNVDYSPWRHQVCGACLHAS